MSKQNLNWLDNPHTSILPGESLADYLAIADRWRQNYPGATYLQQILLRNVIDGEWRILRATRVIATLESVFQGKHAGLICPPAEAQKKLESARFYQRGLERSFASNRRALERCTELQKREAFEREQAALPIDERLAAPKRKKKSAATKKTQPRPEVSSDPKAVDCQCPVCVGNREALKNGWEVTLD